MNRNVAQRKQKKPKIKKKMSIRSKLFTERTAAALHYNAHNNALSFPPICENKNLAKMVSPKVSDVPSLSSSVTIFGKIPPLCANN